MHLIEIANVLAPHTKDDLDQYKDLENYQVNENIDE